MVKYKKIKQPEFVKETTSVYMNKTKPVEEFIKLLPEYLKKNPDIKYKIYEVIEEHFPSREETNRILEEIRISREESNKRFEEQREETNKRIEELREESNKNFKLAMEEIHLFREETNKRFEEQREETNKRFEQMDDSISLTRAVLGSITSRVGKGMENVVAGALRFALKHNDIKAENIKLRQKIVDTTGLLGKKDREYEYDIFASNEIFYIFEIKSYTEIEDIERFMDKVELVIKELNLDKENTKKVFVTLVKDREIISFCDKHNIILC